MPDPDVEHGLRGRRNECETLDRLLMGVRDGHSQVLVLRGEAGAGKTALLEYLQERASGCRVARAAGVESEMEIVFAGLHQLCAPLLSSVGRLPGPQRDALSTAFGLSAGEAPDRFLVGVAALGLLSEVAEEAPFVCLVDDAQWLDRASAQALAFVARRLLAESVAFVFAVREPSEDQEWADLPELAVEGLSDDDARALLDSVVPGLVDERVRDRIVAETGATPSVGRAASGIDRGSAGRWVRPSRRPAARQPHRAELSATARVASDRQPTTRPDRRSEPVGDATLLWSAARRLGIGADAGAPAEAAGLIEFGARVRFRHPLVRAAAYRAAALPDRRQVHRALAEASDPVADADRRAWHRAHVAMGPDEEVAGELERSAGRAQARGGLAAAGAFLESAAELTPDPGNRARRALDAAQAKLQAGAFDSALTLLAMAEEGPDDPFRRARLDLVRAQIAFASNHGSEAASLLLAAAQRFEPLDVGSARATYLEAFAAATFAGRLGVGVSPRDVARAARGRRVAAGAGDSRPVARRPGRPVHGGVRGRDATVESDAAGALRPEQLEAMRIGAGCGSRRPSWSVSGTTRAGTSSPHAGSSPLGSLAHSATSSSRSTCACSSTCSRASSPRPRHSSKRSRR